MLDANQDLDPKLTRAQVAATLPVCSRREASEPYGFMDPERWREFAGFMVDEDLIDAAARRPTTC